MSNCLSPKKQSQAIVTQLERFVAPLLAELDARLDKRLVRTFLRTLSAILTFRHSRYGLLLSELGGYITSPDKAPAGTKRLSNLLRSTRWGYRIVGQFLWERASVFVTDQSETGETTLVVWDESVVEKPESIALEGLCAVRSSTARRLKRIKPGYFNPPGGRPIFVPGMHWLTLLVMGMNGPPLVAAMQWWTPRGKFATKKRPTAEHLLQSCAIAWKQQVLHIWDRGFANGPWLACAFRQRVRFVVRWKTKQKLVDGKGERNAWKVTRGKRSLDHRLIWDNRRRCWRKTGIIFAPVTHPHFPEQPLFLVVSRPGKGRKPWYLLTNEPIGTADDAWRIVLAYARRWQVEMTYRYAKTELAMESPRLWSWHNRLKLLMMVTLVYAFLLTLLENQFDHLRQSLMRQWCHRTGKRYRQFAIPLYRLRSALSRLWLSHPPVFHHLWENPG